MLDAYELWSTAEKEAQTTVITKTGGLDISHRDNEQIKLLIKSAQKYNVPAELMSPAQVKAKFPSISIPDDNIGVYSPDSGIINATKAVGMFQNLAKRNGCIFRDNIVVTKIYQLLEGQKTITIVETNKGLTFKCEKCIVTVGAWAKKFLKNVNIDLPVQPMQTTVAYWTVENKSVYSSSVFPVFINYHQDALIYGCPAHEFPNMIKCCAHFGPEVDPDNRDFLPGMDVLKNTVAPFIQRTFQGVNALPAKTESCMYTCTPDEDFIIDELPEYPGIFIGIGFSGHGFKLAPVVGKLLSQLALFKAHPFPKTKKIFSIERFKQKSKI